MKFGLLLALLAAAPPADDDRCAACGATTAPIRRALAGLHAPHWRERDRAARDLADVRWECHPEVVAALAGSLRDDDKPKVRAEAAETLELLAPNLPSSHVALAAAARDDPSPAVRKHAARALAAKGRRCVVACPICGPVPAGGGITGPTITWPERAGPPRPAPNEPIPAGPTPNLPPLPPG